MYKEKFLKYKNKYLFLKNLQGETSASADASADEYSCGLTYLLDNNNNVLILLERINEMITNSLQPQKNIPVSDKILINLFGLERKEDLSSLKKYIKIIYNQHKIYDLNPEFILDSSKKHLFNIQNYNTHISRLCDMIKINADDKKDLKHLKDVKNLKDLIDLIDLKCLIYSIKRIEGIDRQSLNNSKKQKILEERQKIIKIYKLFSTFDETKLDEYIKKIYEPHRLVLHNKQTPSKKTFFDPIIFDEHNIAEPHFVFNTNKDGEKQCILKDQDFLGIITDLINDRVNTELLINKSNNNLVLDYNAVGCIITAQNCKISLTIKWHVEPGKHCLINSDDSNILNFITKNKVSRKNKPPNYNFVKDTILRNPYILSDDEYRYDFDERLEFNTFKFYKLINRRIFSLLEDNVQKENAISCILCPNCKIYTTSDKTDILCYNCQESYCRICIKKTHPLTGCNEPISKETAEHMDDTYTACPKCKQLFERSEACIHMKCITCSTEFCHLCGELWYGSFNHIWDGLCSEVVKYPRLKEYIPILRSKSVIINISKPQLRALQKYPKLLEHLITTQDSIIKLGDTPKKLEELKKRFSNSTACEGGI